MENQTQTEGMKNPTNKEKTEYRGGLQNMKKDCYYSNNLAMILEKNSLLRRKDVLTFSDIREWIIEQATTSKNDAKYKLLKQFMSYLSFQHGHKQDGKLTAIIAGSYPSVKAESVATYRDIDIWILWSKSQFDNDFECYKWVELLYRIDLNLNYDYSGTFPGLLRVATSGKVQFLIIKYDKEEFENDCHCDYHIQDNCFPMSHNITRYRLLVFEKYQSEITRLRNEKVDLAIPCYIPYSQNILAKRTALTHEMVENDAITCYTEPDTKQGRTFTHDANCMKCVKNRERECWNCDGYPEKHLRNRPSLSPPKLFYQALLTIMKNTGCS
jgi:hypothetical protein